MVLGSSCRQRERRLRWVLVGTAAHGSCLMLYRGTEPEPPVLRSATSFVSNYELSGHLVKKKKADRNMVECSGYTHANPNTQELTH